MRLGILALALPLVVAPLVAFQRGGAPAPDPPPQTAKGGPFTPFEPLLGNWRGTSTGKYGEEVVEKHYELVLGGKFLQGTSRSVARRAQRHDLGILSFDTTRKTHVLREFRSDGSVNQYTVDVQDGGRSLVFEAEVIENAAATGLRARNTLIFVSDDEIKETFSLTTGDEPWEVYVETVLKRSVD